jgi:SRSO17 transposase
VSVLACRRACGRPPRDHAVFVRTTSDLAVAVGHSVDPAAWRGLFDTVMARVAGRFARVEPRRTARAFVLGLLSGIERKNCWWLAEHAGRSGPQTMQRLLREAVWDADALRDDVRDLVVEHLGHPDGVLIPDETGFCKKGTHSVAVQRQYTGTAGRIENAQVAVFLGYASTAGRALIDRRIYLPACWSEDCDRRAAAGVPTEVEFATKPRLAFNMIADAIAADVPAGWVAADEVYGNDAVFRAGVQALGLGYVLAVACDHRVTVNHGRSRMRADHLAAGLPDTAWQQLSAGVGAKGPRWYAWAWIQIDATGSNQTLLIRRNTTTGELAFYRCYSPAPVTLSTLVRVAGIRWSVEESFQAAKGQVGLDHYQVRGWTPWHRFVTLAMLALALLTALATRAAPAANPDPHRHAHDNGPIAHTTGEIRRLFNALLNTPPAQLIDQLRWSSWRRNHQGRARQAHYRRRLTAASSP